MTPTPAPIRPARPADADAMTALYRASVEGVGARDYNAEQVRVWAALAPSPDRWRAMMADGRLVLAAVDASDRLLAFGDLEADGHIDFLYAAPDAAGTGVVAALYAALEAEARARAIPRLYSEASEAACRFFTRRGFTVLHRRDLEVDGVAIHNYAVEKALA
ncbi:MAG: GNAT family N-acetyltransferase [Caenispirillum bisanense]|nr:GNAT family N-acetyltransferase [Caenispirillum bisanense]